MNRKYKNIDWCALIYILKKEGVTYQKISDVTGFSLNHIYNIKEEITDPDIMDKTINLMLLFLEKTEIDVPIYGEHNDVVKL